MKRKALTDCLGLPAGRQGRQLQGFDFYTFRHALCAMHYMVIQPSVAGEYEDEEQGTR
jgi:hypothetical protein